jgi:transposase
MPKKIDYTLTETELEAVQEAMHRDKRPDVRQRATAIHLLHQGMKPAETAAALAVSPATIYNWHGRWRAEGLAGLADRPRPGRKPKATPAYVQRLEAGIEQDPQALGYAFSVWTVDRRIEQLDQETGIRLSPNRFRALLKKHGYVYRRPKHDRKELQDPEAQAQAEAWLDELKRGRWRASMSSSLWTRAPSASTLS